MRIEKAPMLCRQKGCGATFYGELVMDCPVNLFVAGMKAVRCPKCGAGYKKLSFRIVPEPPAPAPQE